MNSLDWGYVLGGIGWCASHGTVSLLKKESTQFNYKSSILWCVMFVASCLYPKQTSNGVVHILNICKHLITVEDAKTITKRPLSLNVSMYVE